MTLDVTHLRELAETLDDLHTSECLRDAADEIERLRGALAAAEAVIVYYAAKNWPAYSDREREAQTWKPTMTATQVIALAHWNDRWRAAHAVEQSTARLVECAKCGASVQFGACCCECGQPTDH